MTLHIGMLTFPNLTQLDLTGPFEILVRIPDAKVHLLWKTLEPVASDAGFVLQPTATLENAPPLDVVFVPGGAGQIPLMEDEAVLSFLQRTAARARYVTAVCTGSLLLGAAGLLEGYRATTHWAYHELLAKCGATPVRERVVVDRNRVTGGGVTSGIDFALRLAAELGGDELSRSIQLMVEYDPEPPYHSGTPVNAEARLVERARAQLEPFRAKREAILDARLRRA